jgi:hypothetical protein
VKSRNNNAVKVDVWCARCADTITGPITCDAYRRIRCVVIIPTLKVI